MSAIELLLRILAALKPMLPGLLAAGTATLVMLVVLAVMCRNTWVQDKHFGLVGLFFGLDARSSLRLSCTWLRLIFLLVFVAGFQKLELIHYMMLLIPGILLALGECQIRKKIEKLFWLALQTAGLLSANLICGYYRDMSGGLGFLLLYAAMGVFLVLFAIYLFLNDLADISLNRYVDAGQVWTQDEKEEADD